MEPNENPDKLLDSTWRREAERLALKLKAYEDSMQTVLYKAAGYADSGDPYRAFQVCIVGWALGVRRFHSCKQGDQCEMMQSAERAARLCIRSCCNPTHLKQGTHQENMAMVVFPTGTAHWAAKLTAKQVEEIRILRSKGGRSDTLAKIYGVDQGTINNVVAGRTFPS